MSQSVILRGLLRAVATCGHAMATGAESVSVVKVALLAGIIGCVMGLKLLSEAA